ncbi:MAG: acyltransferase family protein [Chitinophagales bacterium]
MSKRFLPLDGVRGLAVLMVFFSHTSGRGQYLHEYLNFTGIGHIGVYLFFVLSGFLLSMGLFSEGVNTKSLKKFYIKRTLRIIPLYYFVCLSVFIYQEYTGNFNERYLHIEGGTEGLLNHFLFIQADGLFWSILIEMHFYLAVPLIIFTLIKFRIKAVCFWLLIAVTNGFLYLSYKMHKFDVTNGFIKKYLSLHSQGTTFIDIFIFGILAAYLLRFHKEYLYKNRMIIHRLALTAFSVLMVMVFILVTKHFLIFERPFFHFRFFSIIYGIVFSLLVLSVYLDNPWNKYFSFAWLRFIGVIGFSFYLLHFAVLQFVNTLPLYSGIKFFISFVLVCAISKISFELIENPSVSLAKWINKKVA